MNARISTRPRLYLTVLFVGILGLTGCTNGSPNRGKADAAAKVLAIHAAEAQAPHGPAITAELLQTAALAATAKVAFVGRAQLGVLYFLDRPANRDAVLSWLKDSNATIKFENTRFGYLDAELDWKDLGGLIAKASQTGLDPKTLLKVQLEVTPLVPSPVETVAPSADSGSTLFGAVHSAGYGAKVSEFRDAVALEMGRTHDDIAGQGIKVAVFDGGIDLSRTDVYQNRIVDFLVGDDANYQLATRTIPLTPSTGLTGLEDIQANPAMAATLRFASLSEADESFDLNGSGSATDVLDVAVYVRDGQPEARFRVTASQPFGDALRDFGDAQKEKLPALINLGTGKYFSRTGLSPSIARVGEPSSPSTSAVGVKFRAQTDGTYAIAFVGEAVFGEHGIANLHMVGGNLTDATGQVHWQGAAPSVEFIALKTWKNQDEYGSRWIPLARNILQAVDAGADVLDLDIWAPGARDGNDLLSTLLCRVTDVTDVVPVVASHNFGPLPGTVQSLSQGRCVLGIGASNTLAGLKQAFRQLSVDPALGTADDALQTALYSGRGFGMNGLMKPDLISPAYGYTAYGDQMVRFSGTSGATPTTAGTIALLKQAARLKGVELGLEEVKFLYQGASLAVDPRNSRDGYGFLNLLASWKQFHMAYLDNTGTRFTPLVLALSSSSPSSLQFDARPPVGFMTVNLTRIPTVKSGNSPETVKFWIEYAGASADSASGVKSDWLRFLDGTNPEPTSTLTKDVPMNGELQALKLAFNLSDLVWASLPPGDHIAFIKGVRASRLDIDGKNGRAVDFVIPVSFTKSSVIDETSFTIDPLYVDQYRTLSITTSPEDHLFIYAQSECAGNSLPSTLPGNPDDGLGAVIDNEAMYSHASSVMSTYAPLKLSSTPIEVTAHRGIVRIAVYRRSQGRCDGALGGKIIVRRAGFKIQTAPTLITETNGAFAFQLAGTIGLSQGAGALVPTDFDRGANYVVSLGQATLKLRESVTAGTTFVVPTGLTEVRVIPANSNTFQGALLSQKADGTLTDENDTNSPMTAGFSSQTEFYRDEYQGLHLKSPDVGNTISFLPAWPSSSSSSSSGSAIIELTFNASAIPGVASKLTSPATIASWLPDATQPVSATVQVASHLPDALAAFPASSWTASLELPVAVTEHSTNEGVNQGATNEDLELWRGVMPVAVQFH
jgi:hypothetical protein